MSSALMSVREVAEHLGVAPATVYDWRVDRKGPKAIKVGRLVKFKREDVDAWVDGQAE